MRLLGRFSEGFRLAAEYGRASGVVSEYAYRNQPQGRGRLGRILDRCFLGSRAWKSSRQHFLATRELVEAMVVEREARGLATTILDIASGTAPHLRELVASHGKSGLVVVCHDRDPDKVTLGREIIRSQGLKGISFNVGDATDQSSYLTNRDPDILLAIDLFPWFEREEAVRKTLQLAHQKLRPDGCFVCSTMTRDIPGERRWHADEFGKPPVLRSPATMREWLAGAGFADIEVREVYTNGAALIGWKRAAPAPVGSGA